MNYLNNILITDNADETITYHKNQIDSEYRYMPEFDEFIKMFEDDPESLFKIDSSKCITAIDKSGNEYSVSTYNDNNLDKVKDIVFLKITNDILKVNNAEIYIDFDLYKSAKIDAGRWSNNKNKIYASKLCDYVRENVKTVYDVMDDSRRLVDGDDVLEKEMALIDGYKICQDIMMRANEMNGLMQFGDITYKIEANDPITVLTCDKKSMKCGGNDYKGYLPSLYQMELICRYMQVIDYFIAKTIMKPKYGRLEKIPFLYQVYGRFWTVNEFDKDQVFGVERSRDKARIRIYNKSMNLHVFPIYKKIN